MARHAFAGDLASWAFTDPGTHIPVLAGGVTITAWNASTGGSQVTDLALDAAGVGLVTFVTTSTTSPYGTIPPFYGPDGVWELWLSAGGGPRLLAVATDAGDTIDALQADVDLLAGGDTIIPLHIPGLVADGLTDQGPTIQAVLDSIGPGVGTHAYRVLAEVSGAGVIYINSTVQVESSHTTLWFGNPVLFGPLGRVRISGDVVELPTTGKPRLTVDAAAGATTITVSSVSLFTVNCSIKLRGGRDVTGNPAADQKEIHTVTGISGLVLTLREPLVSAFLAVNPNVGAPAGTTHDTEVTLVVSTLCTTAPVRGDRSVTVVSTAAFTVGCYVQIADDTNTTVASTGAAEPSNYVHREIAEVKGIPDGTHLRLSHSLHHGYDLATQARVILTEPVVHSAIDNAYVTWSAMSTVGIAFEIRNGVHCQLRNLSVNGDLAGGTSWLKQALRLTDSYLCDTVSCYVRNAVDTTSGSGYGATLYGSTNCRVLDSQFSTCRHSVLLFNGAAGNLIRGVFSEDVSVSDLDLHGAECVDNVFDTCYISGGDSVAGDGSTNKTAMRAGNTTHSNGDRYNSFLNCTVVNYGGSGMEVVPSSTDTLFQGCKVLNALTGVTVKYATANTALVSSDTVVRDCEFADVPTPLNIDGNAATLSVRRITIEDCRFSRAVLGLTPKNAATVTLRRNVFSNPAIPTATYSVNGNNITGLQVYANDFTGCTRGVKLTTCPAAMVTGNILHNLVETQVYEDAGANTGTVFRDNDIAGFTPARAASGTGPSTGGMFDAGICLIVAAVTGATTVYYSRGPSQRLNLTGAATLTFTDWPPTGQDGVLRLLIAQDATGSRVVTWPTITWDGGSAPTQSTAANKVDQYEFRTTTNGTTVYGRQIGRF